MIVFKKRIMKKVLDTIWEFYFKNYKIFMIVPVLFLIFSLSIIVNNMIKTGDIMKMDVSLKGGTTISIATDKLFEIKDLNEWFLSEFKVEDVSVRRLTDVVSGKINGYTFGSTSKIDLSELKTKTMEKFQVEEETLSIAIQGPILGENFIAGTSRIILIALILMGITIFWRFKKITPAISILFSTSTDIFAIITALSLMGERLSIASIGALLMIIGYSTESDVLLATNILKKEEGTLKERMKDALKTEITMDITALVCFGVMWIVSTVTITKEISLVLLLGLIFNFIDTWFLGAGLQRMYAEKK